MKIFVNTLSGRSIILEDLEACDTIETVMKEVETKEGVPCSLQRLVYAGKKLEGGGRVLSDYGVKEACTLHLVLGLRGGSSGGGGGGTEDKGGLGIGDIDLDPGLGGSVSCFSRPSILRPSLPAFLLKRLFCAPLFLLISFLFSSTLFCSSVCVRKLDYTPSNT
jgi:hypothetical protein